MVKRLVVTQVYASSILVGQPKIYAGLAQLVERLIAIQKAEGSNPLSRSSSIDGISAGKILP